MGSDADWHYLAYQGMGHGLEVPQIEYSKMKENELTLLKIQYSEDHLKWIHLEWGESGLTKH